MSSKITILGTGYATIKEQGATSGRKIMSADGSCCLIQSSGLNVLFDTMGPWQRDKLLDGLSQLKIHQDDINYLVCSHSHPDHIGNLNLFTSAKAHIIGTSVYRDDEYDLEYFEPIGDRKFTTSKGKEISYILYEPFKIDQNLYIDHTPGHTMECISMIVDNCDTYGKVGLVGDLFERKDDIDDESIWISAGSQNPDLQRAHRQRIYNQVTYVLPGHGPLFRRENRGLK